MKKLKQSWQREYKPLRLFKNDLEDIVNIAKEYEQIDAEDWKKNITINAKNYELDNISELKEIREEFISDFYLNVGVSSLVLRLSEHSISLRVDDDRNMLLMGIAHKIDDILESRQRRFNFLFTYSGRLFIFYLPSLILFGFFAGVLLAAKSYFLSAFSAIASIYVAVKAPDISVRYATIILSYFSERPNFFKRNKDKIIVNAITAIVTVGLTILGTLLIQSINKESYKENYTKDNVVVDPNEHKALSTK